VKNNLHFAGVPAIECNACETPQEPTDLGNQVAVGNPIYGKTKVL